MTNFSVYQLSDGLFTGLRVSGNIEDLPAGCAKIEGVFDHLRQRVDLKTMQVVEYRPPKPTNPLADWTWDEDTKTWLPLPTKFSEQFAQRMQLLSKIGIAESKQLRALREFAVASSPDEKLKALAFLEAIETEIVSLRVQLPNA